MIIDNGTLQSIDTRGGGIEGGIPIPVIERLGEPVPCNIRVNTHDHHGRGVDGVFERTDLTVLIDADTTPTFTALRVAVTDNRGQRLGTFRVQDVQYLDSVGAIQIALSHAD